jgi:hypothetical protein
MRIFGSSSFCGALMTFALAGSTAPALAKNPTSDATASTTVVQTCSWDRPGHDPFMGDVVAAIDRYQDIPVEVRERLKARMVKREYDDIVTIRRDTIEGKARYGGVIRDMHFGDHQVCRTVTRSAWSPKMQERGLVYCATRAASPAPRLRTRPQKAMCRRSGSSRRFPRKPCRWCWPGCLGWRCRRFPGRRPAMQAGASRQALRPADGAEAEARAEVEEVEEVLAVAVADRAKACPPQADCKEPSCR